MRASNLATKLMAVKIKGEMWNQLLLQLCHRKTGIQYLQVHAAESANSALVKPRESYGFANPGAVSPRSAPNVPG